MTSPKARSLPRRSQIESLLAESFALFFGDMASPGDPSIQVNDDGSVWANLSGMKVIIGTRYEYSVSVRRYESGGEWFFECRRREGEYSRPDTFNDLSAKTLPDLAKEIRARAKEIERERAAEKRRREQWERSTRVFNPSRTGNPTMKHVTARSSDHAARRSAAIRALGGDPRRWQAWVDVKGDGADVWQVARSDRHGEHFVGKVSVSYGARKAVARKANPKPKADKITYDVVTDNNPKVMPFGDHVISSHKTVEAAKRAIQTEFARFKRSSYYSHGSRLPRAIIEVKNGNDVRRVWSTSGYWD